MTFRRVVLGVALVVVAAYAYERARDARLLWRAK